MSRQDTPRERVNFYRFLARLYRREADGALLEGLKKLVFPQADGDTMRRGYGLLADYLARCGADALDALAADYAGTFLCAGSAQVLAALPYESVYTSDKQLVMQEAWEEVGALFREQGLKSADDGLMADHLALELEFMAYLLEQGKTGEAKTFLYGHLLNWLPAFLGDVRQYAQTDFYRAAGLLTEGFLDGERALFGEPYPAYSVRSDRMDGVIARLEVRYRLFAPVRQKKRGPKGTDVIRYGEIHHLTDIVYSEKSRFSAKEVFYPISQTLLYFKGDACEEAAPEDARDIILFLRPCDIHAVRRLDTIFLQNGQPDSYYARIRRKLHFFLLECRDGFDNCFCVSMGSNRTDDYAAAVRIDDICALLEIRDETFLPYFADEVPAVFTPRFVTENRRKADLPVIGDRAQLEAVCKHPYWEQYNEACIGCGGCNMVCPTCSCFDTVDVIYDQTSRDGERRRVWSGCMLEDFTRTAGGGRVRKTPGQNMRFKVLHKVYDYKLRFGAEHMCVGCGRCIDQCPKEIDYLDAVNGLSRLLEKGEC